MPTARRSASAGTRAVLFGVLLTLCFALSAEAAGPKRVLILHSFGRDFAPFDTVTSVFRTELARRSAMPIDFVEANLDFRRSSDEREQRIFLDHLRARFDDAPPDVVVTIGAPAARFFVRHRAELFPSVPVVLGGLDERNTKQVPLLAQDSIVAGRVELPRLIDNILQLLPGTTTIAVVIGASEIERFWRNEMQREAAPYAHRVTFEWLSDLSFSEMQERVAKLPPNSAILYGLLVVDAAGVPHEREDALARIHAVANAPVFGLYESELGQGVVGGPYTSQRKAGERTATAALRALGESTLAQPQVDIVAFEPPVYDWRELARWNIDAVRVPPGSEIRYQPPSIWEAYRNVVLGVSVAVLLQALLITALLVQRAHRRKAEQEAAGLAGRLVSAHEDERRRLARELHDDVTQRLAGLAIEAAALESRDKGTVAGDTAHAIRDGLMELGEDVHALSYRLHPSVIEDLGLVEALRAECDRVAQQGSLKVSFDSDPMPAKLPADTALCLFRVAQEALTNIARHARARNVDVRVNAFNGGIALAVRDDGAGFDLARAAQRTSLGLASMRERIRILHGRLDIDSKPGGGTALSAWVPGEVRA